MPAGADGRDQRASRSRRRRPIEHIGHPGPGHRSCACRRPVRLANLRLSQDFLSTGGVKKHHDRAGSQADSRRVAQVNASPAYA
ncbi:MAG: hypothetical protein WKF75_11335 [Singulisphaera sp.]